jgi:hypothetical protein
MQNDDRASSMEVSHRIGGVLFSQCAYMANIELGKFLSILIAPTAPQIFFYVVLV